MRNVDDAPRERDVLGGIVALRFADLIAQDVDGRWDDGLVVSVSDCHLISLYRRRRRRRRREEGGNKRNPKELFERERGVLRPLSS